jgi:hypothetical protein
MMDKLEIARPSVISVYFNPVTRDKDKSMKTVQLIPFSASPHLNTIGDYSISTTLTTSNHDILAEFALHGDTTALRWPAPAAEATQGKDLWKHTCFELFLAEPACAAYWEYNFSPFRQWAIYTFKDYRQPAPTPSTHTPIIEPPQLSDTAFSLRARFSLESPLVNKPLIIGVAAIIETIDGQRHYYALKHCGDKPDFHLRESFVLKMD